MAVETWFPLAIYIEDLPDAAHHQPPLLDAVLTWEQASEKRSYPGMAWTGDIHGITQIHQDPRFHWIVTQVEHHTLIYLQELGLQLDHIDLYIQRSWPIVTRSAQAVGPHQHPTAHVSAVYYITVPQDPDLEQDPGYLVFFDDARVNEISPGLGSDNTNIVEWTDLNQLEVSYPPVAGRLLIFPAKQRHAVTLNTTHDLRVSLSFDIVLTAKIDHQPGSYEFLTPPPTQWQRFSHSYD